MWDARNGKLLEEFTENEGKDIVSLGYNEDTLVCALSGQNSSGLEKFPVRLYHFVHQK